MTQNNLNTDNSNHGIEKIKKCHHYHFTITIMIVKKYNVLTITKQSKEKVIKTCMNYCHLATLT